MHRFSLASPPFTYDPEEPEGFRAGLYRIGGEAGAKTTGTSVYELPPGQSICPYHYELGEEEWLLVLSGRPTLRTPEGSTELAPLDCIFFPTGPEGAHAVRNDTDATAVVMMYSAVQSPAVCVYPDSDKIGVFDEALGDPHGLNFRRSTGVGYYDGEA